MSNLLTVDAFEEVFEDLDDTDFVFVVDASGDLKGIVFPELDEMPDSVKNMLDFFGVDLDSTSRTLH
jgi:hypothetical protein